MEQSENLMESQINMETLYRKVKTENLFMQGRLDEANEQFRHATTNYGVIESQFKEL